MSDEEDVERFLWDLERALSHVDGDRRRELVQEAEDRLQRVATRIAKDEDAESLAWYHYVQASAEVGPPERLARELTGEPLPDRERSHLQLWIVAGAVVLLVGGLFGYALLTQGDIQPIGTWSGQETQLDAQETVRFNVSQGAEAVFLSLTISPTNRDGAAQVTVLDGDKDLVYEASASVSEHLETTEYLQGAPGEWLVIVDYQNFTGAWRIHAEQER